MMTFDQLATGYIWASAAVSFGGIAWLAFRHWTHINPKVVQRAMIERKKPAIPPDAQARIDRDYRIVGRIGTGIVVGWVLIIMFGTVIAKR